MIDRGKRDLLGVHIDALDMDAAVDRIMFAAAQHEPYSVSALATHGVIEASHDESLRDALNRFDAVLPDGQAVRWALNALHHVELPDKVPGPSVVDVLLDRAAAEALPVFFYGSTPETLGRITDRLEDRYGDALVVHQCPSRFGPVNHDELHEIAALVNASGARICFVGLGCPRQERFVAAIGPLLEMPTLAVGAAFDYLAGSITRAPRLVQRMGMEWGFRLMQEPRRLAGRYFSTNTAFVTLLAGQMVRQRVPGYEVIVDVRTSAAPPWERVDA